MKKVLINGHLTKGDVECNFITSIPVRKNVSFVVSEYLVGLYKGERFVVHYQLGDDSNLNYCIELLKHDYPNLTPVVLKVTNKVQRL